MTQTSIFVASVILFVVGVATPFIKNEDLAFNGKVVLGVILVFLAYLLMMMLLLTNTTPEIQYVG